MLRSTQPSRTRASRNAWRRPGCAWWEERPSAWVSRSRANPSAGPKWSRPTTSRSSRREADAVNEFGGARRAPIAEPRLARRSAALFAPVELVAVSGPDRIFSGAFDFRVGEQRQSED